MVVTPKIVELAKGMLAHGQDCSPEADKLLSIDNSLCLCSYLNGAWIVGTHNEICMKNGTKVEFVLART